MGWCTSKQPNPRPRVCKQMPGKRKQAAKNTGSSPHHLFKSSSSFHKSNKTPKAWAAANSTAGPHHPNCTSSHGTLKIRSLALAFCTTLACGDISTAYRAAGRPFLSRNSSAENEEMNQVAERPALNSALLIPSLMTCMTEQGCAG